jgi:hypothetical protein
VVWLENTCRGFGIKCGDLRSQMLSHEFYCWLDRSVYSH